MKKAPVPFAERRLVSVLPEGRPSARVSTDDQAKMVRTRRETLPGVAQEACARGTVISVNGEQTAQVS